MKQPRFFNRVVYGQGIKEVTGDTFWSSLPCMRLVRVLTGGTVCFETPFGGMQPATLSAQEFNDLHRMLQSDTPPAQG